MKPFNSGGVLGRIGDVVYQRVRAGLGNVIGDPTRTLQVRRHVPHPVQNNVARTAQRSKFAGAVLAWHGETQAVRDAYNIAAKPSGFTGFNRYVSEWMKSL